jgi:hypothetical protein
VLKRVLVEVEFNSLSQATASQKFKASGRFDPLGGCQEERCVAMALQLANSLPCLVKSRGGRTPIDAYPLPVDSAKIDLVRLRPIGAGVSANDRPAYFEGEAMAHGGKVAEFS